MLRIFSLTIAGLVLAAGLALAADHRGYLKSAGTDKITVTVEVEDKDKGKGKAATEKDIDIKTNAETKFYSGTNESSAKDLAKLLAGSEGKSIRVHVKTKGSGPGEVATEVRVAGRRPKSE
jgi:hypothetical protein